MISSLIWPDHAAASHAAGNANRCVAWRGVASPSSSCCSVALERASASSRLIPARRHAYWRPGCRYARHARRTVRLPALLPPCRAQRAVDSACARSSLRYRKRSQARLPVARALIAASIDVASRSPIAGATQRLAYEELRAEQDRVSAERSRARSEIRDACPDSSLSDYREHLNGSDAAPGSHGGRSQSEEPALRCRGAPAEEPDGERTNASCGSSTSRRRRRCAAPIACLCAGPHPGSTRSDSNRLGEAIELEVQLPNGPWLVGAHCDF